MTIPLATARLQLNGSYTLNDARAQVSYYARLGVSHLYLSPISTARPGSTHGYDVVDHQVVNPELGGEPALLALSHSLKEHGMGLILDIVPNHMATHPDNAWWWDVLRHGPGSAYAQWFDIDWNPPMLELTGKVLAPFLAVDYGHSLAQGSVHLVFDDPTKTYQIQAGGLRYPLAAGSMDVRACVQEVLARHDPLREDGRRRLHELLERQYYRLCWWRCAADQINWRRFFEINELIGMRQELSQVFDAVHALPLRLFEQGVIDGLRIDHVDGLARPLGYCRRLRAELEARALLRPGARTGDEYWLIVEKILAAGETLSERWTVDGTTGYDFMDQVSAVLHDDAGESALTANWVDLSGNPDSARATLEQARGLMLVRHFVAERTALLRDLTELAASRVATRDWTAAAIGRNLDRLLTVFPVYRTYVETGVRDAADTVCFAAVLELLRDHYKQRADTAALVLLELLNDWLGGAGAAHQPERQPDLDAVRDTAIRRFQQLTPPLAAKALEDTTFYRYGRLLSRNEVGSDPDVLALGLNDFHQENTWRASHIPRSMLTSATHDQKRGEDVRARLAVLSETPMLWIEACRGWIRALQAEAPVDNRYQAGERYMFFQTLVAAWPPELTLDDRPGLQAYAERLVQWQTKALREAKLNSDWFEPNVAYERTSAEIVRRLMNGAGGGILANVADFVQKIAPAGMVNSLAQVLLRITSPGVPDLYQGTEFWDFSLVDPDNRRPVDYIARHTGLDILDSGMALTELLADWRSGRIKQALISRALRMRHDMPAVFEHGSYSSLPVVGAKSRHVLAFIRTDGKGGAAVTVVPRLCFEAIGLGDDWAGPILREGFWANTRIVLPRGYAGTRWFNALDDGVLDADSEPTLALAQVLTRLPVALLTPAGQMKKT